MLHDKDNPKLSTSPEAYKLSARKAAARCLGLSKFLSAQDQVTSPVSLAMVERLNAINRKLLEIENLTGRLP